MQVFQKKDAYLGGMDEAIAILKLCADDWDALTVHALYDGDLITPYETVLTIEGDYTTFAHLETVYLGTLARRTLITTNVVHVLEAANGKPIIFMPARHDHHRVQTGDGYAAYVAGQVVGAPIGVTTDEQASWWGGSGLGTVPHALIAAYGGDTVDAARHFADWAPDDMNVTVLVDFENDSVRTALDVAQALGPRLWGVRLDTSEALVDRSLWEELGDFRPTGVNPRLVHKVRDALDASGFDAVKIVVSGGFTVDKIREFEADDVPVDAYGVGSSLIRGSNDFTGDIVDHRRPSLREVRPAHAPESAPRTRLVSGKLLWDVDTQVDFVHADGKLAVPARDGGRAGDAAARRRSARGGHPARRLRRRSRADRCRDLGEPRLRDDVSAALPPRHERRGQDRRDEPGRSGAARADRRAGALAARPRVPAAEEELRRVHQPERRRAARAASTPTRSCSSASRPTSATTPRSGASWRAAGRSRSSRRPLAGWTRAARPAAPPPGARAASASPPWTRCSRSFRFRRRLPMGD